MTTEKHIQGSIFKFDGLYRLDWYYDDEKEEGKQTETLVTDFVDIMNLFEYKCEIDNNVTLIQILNAIKDAKIILNPIFHFNYDAHMSSYFGFKGEKEIDPDQYLEIYLNVGTETYKETGTELNHYHGMHLIDPNSEEGIPFSISFSPLYEIGDIPVRINSSPELYYTTWKDKGKIEQGKSHKIDVVHFTLHDILYSIIWELGFVGDPEDKSSAIEDLNEQVKSIEDGTAVLHEVDFDKFMENLDDNTKTD